MITGSREEGMVFGLISGFILGLTTFYYYKGKFSLLITGLQLIINGCLSVGGFLLISNFTENMEISRLSYGYVLIYVSLPTLISINKQLLDKLSKILAIKERIRKPY